MATTKTDDGAQEHDESTVVLGENEIVIDKKNPPKGWYGPGGVNDLVKENVNKTQKNLIKAIKNGERKDIDKAILGNYDIVLNDDGQPEGLEPTEDIDKVREQVAKDVSERYEEKLKQRDAKIKQRDNSVRESAIMEAASGHYPESWTKSYDGEKPLVIEKFRNRIQVDENGNPYPVDKNGDKIINSDGMASVADYMLDENKFGELLVDKTQGSSDFQNGSSKGNGTITRKELSNLGDKEYKEAKKKILNDELQVN